MNFTPTTPGFRFIIHINSIAGGGNDVVMEDFLVTQCCAVPVGLPVELADFEAACENDGVHLNWSTVSES